MRQCGVCVGVVCVCVYCVCAHARAHEHIPTLAVARIFPACVFVCVHVCVVVVCVCVRARACVCVCMRAQRACAPPPGRRECQQTIGLLPYASRTRAVLTSLVAPERERERPADAGMWPVGLG